ncbi:site-2 protease family protein [Oscillospiraceae bacterium MB08-C2-2]|nr:site-2 protease family protein [Oscillospiraceae bacterium MB08-C2-2]
MLLGGNMQDQLFTTFVRVLVIFTALPVHEFAHGFVADRLGDPTPRCQGRLTLNPFAHLDPMGSIALLLFGFGWAKPVSIDARNFKKPKWGMALSSLAGPGANVLMSFIALVCFKLLLAFEGSFDPRFYRAAAGLGSVLSLVISINLYLAVFNLLPIPPLDGSRIFSAVLPSKLYWSLMRYERVIYVILILLMMTGILSIPLRILSGYILDLLNWLTLPLDLLVGRLR